MNKRDTCVLNFNNMYNCHSASRVESHENVKTKQKVSKIIEEKILLVYNLEEGFVYTKFEGTACDLFYKHQYVLKEWLVIAVLI